MLELLDRYGRIARDLRVSLTDRCNLRCSYCMPAEGLPWLATDNVLTDEEMIRILRVAVEMLGVTKLRFTGGEPLLRPGLVSIVAAANKMRTPQGERPELALTTNALGLDKKITALVAAGLDRVNISLDSIDPKRYAQLTRRDRLKDVLKSIAAVQEAGITPLKINSVIMRGQNEQDIVPLLDFCLRGGYELRFIEQMPLGPASAWDRKSVITAEEILNVLVQSFELTARDAGQRGPAPAQVWRVRQPSEGIEGTVGIIASVTQPFCGNCNRTRITADGQVRSCLFSQQETDLRSVVRAGGSDEDIAAAWCGEHRRKPRAHGIDDPDFRPPTRTMSAIGG